VPTCVADDKSYKFKVLSKNRLFMVIQSMLELEKFKNCFCKISKPRKAKLNQRMKLYGLCCDKEDKLRRSMKFE
jgi:hypothetical protein